MDNLLPESQAPAVAAAVETGICRGQELLRWWNSEAPRLVDLDAELPPGSSCRSFFGELQLEGKTTSVMGCLQQSTFKPRTPGSGESPVSLREWVNANFLRKSYWSQPGELPGGFLYRPALVKDAGGASPARTVTPDIDINLGEIGPKYEWAAIRLELLDYMKAFRKLGRYDRWLRRFNKESGYMVFHPAFFRPERPTPPGCVEEVCFGYAVAPWIVIPTFVAYGAGRFYSAIKQYRFFFNSDGSLTIQVAFVVAPRIEKVLDFRGWDPVSATIRLLDLLTLRRTSINRNAHNRIDLYGLTQHVRVHHNLLEGMRHYWEGNSWRIGSG